MSGAITVEPFVLFPPPWTSEGFDESPDHSVTAASCTALVPQLVGRLTVTVSVPVVPTCVVQISVTATALLVPDEDRSDTAVQVLPRLSVTLPDPHE